MAIINFYRISNIKAIKLYLMRGVEPGRKERRGTRREEASDEQRSASEAEQS